MAESGFKLEIDGREHRIPEDLDLNDVVALEEAGYALDQMGSMGAVRFMIWRVLLRHDPDITLDQAGSKVPLSAFTPAAEGPNTVPLPEPEARSGTPGGEGNGNDSAVMSVVETHGVAGIR